MQHSKTSALGHTGHFTRAQQQHLFSGYFIGHCRQRTRLSSHRTALQDFTTGQHWPRNEHADPECQYRGLVEIVQSQPPTQIRCKRPSDSPRSAVTPSYLDLATQDHKPLFPPLRKWSSLFIQSVCYFLSIYLVQAELCFVNSRDEACQIPRSSPQC